MILENIKSLNEAKSKTMAMFIKLFVIRIVANNFFGFINSFWTISSFFDAFLFEESFSKSEGVKEKKATSAPDIKAEQINKISSIRILVI